MDQNELKKFKKKVIQYGQKELDKFKVKLAKDQLVEIENLDLFFDFLTRGKFIRSFLCKKFLDYYQGKEDRSFYDLFLALEIFHSAILIHDDVFDNDYLRRGKKTIFYQYNEQYGKNRDDHLGRSLAIILGDLGFYLSNLFFVKGLKKVKNKTLLLETFFYQVIKTALGEYLDVKAGLLNLNLSQEKIEIINRFKTAEYTFNLPFKLGYLLAIANPNKREINLLEKLSIIMGSIFQIKDDLLNILGDSQLTGKSVGSDLKENKNTILKKIIFDNLSDKEKEFMEGYFGKKDLMNNEFQNFKNKFFQLALDQKVYQFLDKEKKQAVKIIEKLNINRKAKEELKLFVDYLIMRKR